MTHLQLGDLVQDAEDVASGLHAFRDALPRHTPIATAITTALGELFTISALLRQIHLAQGDPRYGPSFYRIHDDVELLHGSLHSTFSSVFNMFARARNRPHNIVWEDLHHQFEEVEGLSLIPRLASYRTFLRAQCDILTGQQPRGLRDLRRRIMELSDSQAVYGQRAGMLAIDLSAPSTPRVRPRQVRQRSPSPRSPSVVSGGWEYTSDTMHPPPMAPEVPLSPTFTSSSSHTLPSTQTSYSDDMQHRSGVAHWAQQVFDGRHPGTRFRHDRQLNTRSGCSDIADPLALRHLSEDGFLLALEIPFDREEVWVSLYWRPQDKRARILISDRNAHGQERHFCSPVVMLKVIRDESCLQLCRARQDGRYDLWARLNFVLYERMVLFYCTFVAMKHQDTRQIPHDSLCDSFELEGDSYETELFGGKVQHGSLRHALRLFQDVSSGVVRIEASALRGPFKDVPLWTAFVSRYAHDPDHVQLENDNVVSLITLRPPPYVFHSDYRPPQDRRGNYILHFTTREDAREFMESWIRLCRSG